MHAVARAPQSSGCPRRRTPRPSTVTVDLDQRQFFAKPIALAFVGAQVDRLLVDERVVEAIEFLLDRFRRCSAFATSFLTEALRSCDRSRGRVQARPERRRPPPACGRPRRSARTRNHDQRPARAPRRAASQGRVSAVARIVVVGGHARRPPGPPILAITLGHSRGSPHNASDIGPPT